MSPFSYECFSSFEEFEIQMALGSINIDIICDMVYDNECPDKYKDYLIERCDKSHVLYALIVQYKNASEEQLQTLLTKAIASDDKTYQCDVIQGLADRRNLFLNVALRVVEFTATNPNMWEDVDTILLKKTPYNVQLSTKILKREYPTPETIKIALMHMWNAGRIILKEE